MCKKTLLWELLGKLLHYLPKIILHSSNSNQFFLSYFPVSIILFLASLFLTGFGPTLAAWHSGAKPWMLCNEYFTTVFGKQMGPSNRMDSKGPQSTSFVDLDLLVQVKNVIYIRIIKLKISCEHTIRRNLKFYKI